MVFKSAAVSDYSLTINIAQYFTGVKSFMQFINLAIFYKGDIGWNITRFRRAWMAVLARAVP